MNEKILVLGSSGYLGTRFKKYQLNNSKFLFHARKNKKLPADLSILSEVKKLLYKAKPTKIINFSALADVDKCENLYLALNNNVLISQNIINSIYKLNLANVYLLNISTDHVYDKKGYSFEEETKIKNIYALTKYVSELVFDKIPSCSLRTNFFGKCLVSNKKSFTDVIIEKIKNNEIIYLFKDVKFNPLYVGSLIKYIDVILDKELIGLYNLGSKNGMSKADFICFFLEEMCLPTKKIKKISIDDIKNLTPRPKDMRMNVEKIEHALNLKMPNIEDQIKLCTEDYKNFGI